MTNNNSSYINNIFNCSCNGIVPINGGGICGMSYSNTTNIITNCYHLGDISNNGGGICGKNMKGYITNCYNIGNMDISSGGMCGSDSSGYITNCYNISSISGRLIGSTSGNSNITQKYCYDASSWSGYNLNILKFSVSDLNIDISLNNIIEPIWTNIDLSYNSIPYYLTSFNRNIFNPYYEYYTINNIISSNSDYYNNYKIVSINKNINNYRIDTSYNNIIFNENRFIPMSICMVGINNINMSYSINTFTYQLFDPSANTYRGHNNNPLTILYVSHEDNSLYLSINGFVSFTQTKQSHIDDIINNNTNISVIVDRILNPDTYPNYNNIIILK
jgi:hypothetical protein